MAIHGAVKYASNHVRDFIQLSDEYAIYETSVPSKWVGTVSYTHLAGTKVGVSDPAV